MEQKRYRTLFTNKADFSKNKKGSKDIGNRFAGLNYLIGVVVVRFLLLYLFYVT